MASTIPHPPKAAPPPVIPITEREDVKNLWEKYLTPEEIKIFEGGDDGCVRVGPLKDAMSHILLRFDAQMNMAQMGG